MYAVVSSTNEISGMSSDGNCVSDAAKIEVVLEEYVCSEEIAADAAKLFSSFKNRINEAVAILSTMDAVEQSEAINLLLSVSSTCTTKDTDLSCNIMKARDDLGTTGDPSATVSSSESVRQDEVLIAVPNPGLYRSGSHKLLLNTRVTGARKQSVKQCGRNVTRKNKSNVAPRNYCNENGFPEEYYLLLVTEDDLNPDDDNNGGDHIAVENACSLPGNQSKDEASHSDAACGGNDHQPEVMNIDGKRIFSCRLCPKHYERLSSFKSHIFSHTKPFVCSVCNTRFANKDNLQGHERIHTGEKPYKCPQCDATFRTKPSLNVHVKIHSEHIPFECPECSKRFKLKSTLNAHLPKHPSYANSHCSGCHKSLLDQPGVDTSDKGQLVYLECTRCFRRFDQQACLDMHILKMHTKPEKSVCPTCGKQFSTVRTLKAHVAACVESPKKEFLCDHCGKGFRQKLGLRNHVIRHGTRNHCCQECPSKFFTKFALEKHMLMHTGERPYSCQLCGKSYRDKMFLKYHLNRHYGLEPYKCKYCPKGFADLSLYCRHIRAHEGRLK